jgi:hypothetical protein
MHTARTTRIGMRELPIRGAFDLGQSRRLIPGV